MKNLVDEFNGTHDAMEYRETSAVALLMAALVRAFCPLREGWGHIAGPWPWLPPARPLTHRPHGHGRHGYSGTIGCHGADRSASGG